MTDEELLVKAELLLTYIRRHENYCLTSPTLIELDRFIPELRRRTDQIVAERKKKGNDPGGE